MYGFVYLTTNLINGKKYVGRRKGTPEKRRTYLGSGKTFKEALKKYGGENFVREILEECDTFEELKAAEEKWISDLDAVESVEFYNLSPDSDGFASTKTPEHRKKISEALKGRKLSDEHRKKLSEVNKGKKMDPEFGKQQSARLKGKPKPEGFSERMKENWHDEHPHWERSDEYRAKFKRPQTESSRSKISEKLKGKPKSPETRERMRLAQIKRYQDKIKDAEL